MDVTIRDADVASSVTFVVVFVLQAVGDRLKQSSWTHPVLKSNILFSIIWGIFILEKIMILIKMNQLCNDVFLYSL